MIRDRLASESDLSRRSFLGTGKQLGPAHLSTGIGPLDSAKPIDFDGDGHIDLVTVDYLADELPGGRAAIFLSNVIHSEDEATNAELMRKCFRALRPGGLVIIKDHIMNHELTAPRPGAIFSLYLLLTTRGRDYSYDEVAGWLGQAGFGYMGIHPLPDPPFSSSLVTARKP